MYRRSKYLRYTNTNLNQLQPNKSYRFTGTFDGITIHAKQTYSFFRQKFITELQPVLSFSNVSLDHEHFTCVKFTFREMLTKVPLNRGDIISFDTRLREYKTGGLYSGDLLVNAHDLKNESQNVFKSSAKYKKNKDHVLYDFIVNGRNIYYYSLVSPESVSNCLYKIISERYTPTEHYRNKHIKKEAKYLQDLIPDFPSILRLYANTFPHKKIEFMPPTIISLDPAIYESNIFQELQALNKKGHLITSSKWIKLQMGNGTEIFYILLNALKRSQNFLTKAKD